MYTFKKENSWRSHQEEFLAVKKKNSLRQRASKFLAALAGLVALVLGTLWFLGQDAPSPPKAAPAPAMAAYPPAPKAPELTLPGVRDLIKNIAFLNAGQVHFFVDTPGESYTVHTQLDMKLQEQMTEELGRLKQMDRGKPQRIAMIAMDPETGLIKAMAGFDLGAPDTNPCTSADYPAASIFKIVTASAAVDTLGYTADTQLFFNGQKYTLYKRQLNDIKNKYTSRVTLAEAFAESINPVFGKIGRNELGKETLGAYAQAFGFNQAPETDLTLAISRFTLTDNDYHTAELGCGFNRDTQISPVFAAMMVSAVLNRGQTILPRMVDRIEAASGEVIYKSEKQIYKTPITPKTAQDMIRLMEKTVTSGTAKGAFRGYARDDILSKLVIGGKTGSLYSRDRTVKYDWFTGFGQHKKTGKSLVLAVVVGHRKYIGTRASAHARAMLKTYFYPRSENRTADQN